MSKNALSKQSLRRGDVNQDPVLEEENTASSDKQLKSNEPNSGRVKWVDIEVRDFIAISNENQDNKPIMSNGDITELRNEGITTISELTDYSAIYNSDPQLFNCQSSTKKVDGTRHLALWEEPEMAMGNLIINGDYYNEKVNFEVTYYKWFKEHNNAGYIVTGNKFIPHPFRSASDCIRLSRVGQLGQHYQPKYKYQDIVGVGTPYQPYIKSHPKFTKEAIAIYTSKKLSKDDGNDVTPFSIKTIY